MALVGTGLSLCCPQSSGLHSLPSITNHCCWVTKPAWSHARRPAVCEETRGVRLAELRSPPGFKGDKPHLALGGSLLLTLLLRGLIS